MAVPREVLLVYGENKREVLLPPGSDALKAIRDEFLKFLPTSSNCKGEELLLQRFSKKWDSYIDITSASEICNGDKVTICEKKLMKATEVTLKGKGLCSEMEKPCEADSHTLRSLFPFLSVSKQTNSKAFNPLDDCIVSKEKRQKKGVRQKPRKVTVVLITDKASTKVPRGLKRKDLLQRGYIKQIEFLRNMSAQEVRNKIIRAFPDKIREQSTIAMLMADPKLHILTKVEEREGGADAADVLELAGQGSLYVRITNEDNSASVAEDETCEVEVAKVDAQKQDFSDDDDNELFVVDFKKPKMSEAYDEWHTIRKEQNETFAESLRIDQEKDRQAAALKEKKEACEHLKETILCLLSKKVHTEDSIKLGIRMTNGTVVNALFHPQDSTKLVYQYVFANTDIGNHFKLCTADVPILADDKTLSQYGITSPVLLIVETTEESYFNEEEWITEITEFESTVDAKFIERVLRNEEESRIKFMKSVSLCTAVVSPHSINRISLFEDLLKLYNTDSEIATEYPLQMEYVGENAVDLGGVSRDVMSAFWQLAYEKLFDGSKLLVPVISPHVDLSLLPTIGKILSHGYLCTGFLPVQT